MSINRELVGHWTMDNSDTSNGTLYDRSARDNHGIVGDGTTTGDSGQVAQYFDFEGSGGAVSAGTPSPDLTEDISIAFWIRSDNPTAQRETIINKAYGGVFTVNVETDSDPTTLRFYHGDAGGNSQNYESNDWRVINTGLWDHYVWTRDISEFEEYLWKNGSLVSTRTISIDPVQGNNPITIGSGYTNTLDGGMDDVRIYTRKLSESDISVLYNMRSQRQQNTNGANVEDLVLHLNARNKRSVDQSNNRWKDISGNGNEAHGTSGNGVVDNNLFPNWEPVNGGRFILNGSEGFNVPGPVETTGQVSLESWFKRTDTSSDVEYLSDARNGSGNWHLTNYVGYNINFGRNLKANDPAGTDFRNSGSSASPDSNFFNRWTHLVATSDGNTSQLFIDGEQITDDRLRTSSPFQTGIGKDFAIANRYTGSAHLQGFIAVYRIYDRVLSPAQVKANYDSGKRFYQ